MSVLTADRTTLAHAAQASERRHRFLLHLAAWAAVLVCLLLGAYGFNYYTLDAAHRALSPKHELLKPGGTIGIRLGITGAIMFCAIFLYALRKRWPWLGKIGTTKHWLDFHIVLGLTAPVIITFHSSFKFGGIAGIAYWIMIVVALSGIAGRYIYAQIPRSLGDAELSLKELQELSQALTRKLTAQTLVAAKDLAPLFHPTDSGIAQAMSTMKMLTVMLAGDVSHRFVIWRLRRKALGSLGILCTLGGIFPSRRRELEDVIECAKKQASLSTRITFLSRTQELFRLWHVVHRPFSYSFAVLVCIHITVVLLFGYS
jgi:TRAP-type C4-dicarboxylate transport system permease small subunit